MAIAAELSDINLAQIYSVTKMLDRFGELRTAIDPTRGILSAYYSWGAASANQTIFTKPSGATRCLIVGLFICHSAGSSQTIQLFDGGSAAGNKIFPTVQVGSAVAYDPRSLDKNQLGGGLPIATDFRATPGANNFEIVAFYIAEYTPLE